MTSRSDCQYIFFICMYDVFLCFRNTLEEDWVTELAASILIFLLTIILVLVLYSFHRYIPSNPANIY